MTRRETTVTRSTGTQPSSPTGHGSPWPNLPRLVGVSAYVVVVQITLIQSEAFTGSRFRPPPEEFEMLHLAIAGSDVTACGRLLSGWPTVPRSEWDMRIGAHCPQCHHVPLPED